MNFNKNRYGLSLYSALLLFTNTNRINADQQVNTSMPLAVAINAQLSPHAQQLRLIRQVIAYAQLQNLPTPELTVLYEQLKNDQPITQATAYPALQKISAILPAIYHVPYKPYHELLNNPQSEIGADGTRAPRPTQPTTTGASSINPPISQLVAAAISAALNSIKTSANPFIAQNLVVNGTLTAQGKVTLNKDGNTYNFPTTRGSYAQVLKLSDNSGTLSWQYAAGDVTGPSSATNNAVARFDGASGKIVQNSAVTVSDTGAISTTGGATITGTTAINTTGAATTTIGGSGTGKIAVETSSTTIGTGSSAGNTLLLQAHDVNGASDTTFATLTAGDTPTMDLSDSVTKSGGYIYHAGGTTIPVSQGGTGATTLTTHGLLVGAGTDAVTALGEATNGQIPIGSTGANPVLGTGKP